MSETSARQDLNEVQTAGYSDFISGDRRYLGGAAWFDLAQLYAFHHLRDDIMIGETPLPLEYLIAPNEVGREDRSKGRKASEGRKFVNSLDQLVVASLKQMLILIDETAEDLDALRTPFSSDTKTISALQPKTTRLRFWRKFVDRTVGQQINYRILDKV
jgi:hypothetical protein